MLGEIKLYLYFKTSFVLVSFYLTSLLLDQHAHYIVRAIFSLSATRLGCPFDSGLRLMLWNFSFVIFSTLGFSSVGLLIWTLLLMEKRSYIPEISNLFESIDFYLETIAPDLPPLIMINNSYQYIDEFMPNLSEFMNFIIWKPHVECQYLSPLPQNIPRLVGQVPPDAEVVKRLVKSGLILSLWGLLVFGGTSMMLATGGALPASFFLIIIFILTWNGDVEEYINPDAKIPAIRNGVYRLTKFSFGLNFFGGSDCIGTCYNSVMHAPYHGVQNSSLEINGMKFKPFMSSPNADLVTWGGPPQMVKAEHGEDLVVHLASESGTRSYSVKASVTDDGSFLAFPMLSQPGESGSPVLNSKGELVALAGRCVQSTVEGYPIASEYAILLESQRMKEMKALAFEKLCLHPGAGKTRTHMPNRIINYLKNEPGNKTILVAGPTRVVCTELYNALKEKIGPQWLSLDILGTPQRPSARIHVAAHSSALAMINSGRFPNLGYLIIDEAHVAQADTHSLVKLGRKLNEDGVSLLLMSATFDDESSQASNFEIEDIHIKEKDFIPTIVKEYQENQKIIVFVPGLKGKSGAQALKTQLVKEQIPSSDIGVLSRDTFENEIKLLEQRNIILCTNIAECGFNWNADVVVDLGLHTCAVENAGVISLVTREITKASYVQRRGRIGRSKPGRYYYLYQNHPANFRGDEAYLMESEMYDPVQPSNNPWKIYLTPAQRRAYHTYNYPPHLITLMFGNSGKLRTGSDLVMEIANWNKGKVKKQHCNKGNNCPCLEPHSWWDDRYHDVLVNLQHGKIELDRRLFA